MVPSLILMARQHLWRHTRNYGHGTGHGVGAFLNVHEGPQSFLYYFLENNHAHRNWNNHFQ
ncbi:MAG: hypothetical protein R2784_01630 [Saprospiraceae bacterium]